MDLVPACVSRQARARTEGPPHAACTEAARTASLWYDSEQVGVCVQRRAMSGSRAVAAKVVKSRQEPNLVNADRITTSTGKLQGCPPAGRRGEWWHACSVPTAGWCSNCCRSKSRLPAHGHKLSPISRETQESRLGERIKGLPLVDGIAWWAEWWNDQAIENKLSEAATVSRKWAAAKGIAFDQGKTEAAL